MSRFLRELRETEGKPSAVGRLARGLGALGVLGGGALSGSCLVTNEFDFKTPDMPPRLIALSPDKFTRVKTVSDSDCLDRPGTNMLFRVAIIERDPAQRVYVHLFVNGSGVVGLDAEELTLNPIPGMGTTYRVCVQHSDLNALCNRVQLITGHLLNDVRSPPVDGAINPQYNEVEWTVLGNAKENADANPATDCARRFGVSSPDGSVTLPPADGGTLFPVGIPPTTSDGGL